MLPSTRPTYYVSNEPRYLRVAEQLRQRIVAGEFPPHSRLPGDRTLSKALGTSRQTTVKALGVLMKGKLLYHIAGIGYFVAVPGDPPRCPTCGRVLDGV